MDNNNIISYGLLLSVEPLDINQLHLNDDDSHDKFDWQSDKTVRTETSMFAKLLGWIKP
jgi:hypothetical protein